MVDPAAWPTTDEIAQVLNVDNTTDWELTFARIRQAAIDYVKLKRGRWVEGTDAPDVMLSQAALRMAEMMAQRPTATTAELGNDPTFVRLMYGHRQRFGIA